MNPADLPLREQLCIYRRDTSVNGHILEAWGTSDLIEKLQARGVQKPTQRDGLRFMHEQGHLPDLDQVNLISFEDYAYRADLLSQETLRAAVGLRVRVTGFEDDPENWELEGQLGWIVGFTNMDGEWIIRLDDPELGEKFSDGLDPLVITEDGLEVLPEFHEDFDLHNGAWPCEDEEPLTLDSALPLGELMLILPLGDPHHRLLEKYNTGPIWQALLESGKQRPTVRDAIDYLQAVLRSAGEPELPEGVTPLREAEFEARLKDLQETRTLETREVIL